MPPEYPHTGESDEAERSRDNAPRDMDGTDPPWTEIPAAGGHATAPGSGARPRTGDDPGSVPPGGSEPPPTQSASLPPRGWRRWRTRLLAGVGVVAVALGSGVAGAEIALGQGTSTPAATSTPVAATADSGGAAEHLAKVAAAVSPSVVSIDVRAGGQEDEGSGVILRSDGTILTNNHVVAPAANGGTITVTYSDGTKASARSIGRDPTTDLAVIKANGGEAHPPAALGDSSGLRVGDTVLAIGSPLGLEGSVTAGIVSALHRTITLDEESQPPQTPGNPFAPPGSGGFSQQPGSSSAERSTPTVVDAIQTDAAINPGNSGGPLVDDAGRVVGITTAAALRGGGLGGRSGSIGVGFAIPIDQAASIAKQLIRGQQPEHAQLGVQVGDATSRGALIAEVVPSSPAAKAGLRAGDVITAVDGKRVADANALVAAVRTRQPGDKLTITYTRDGQAHTTTATLGSVN